MDDEDFYRPFRQTHSVEYGVEGLERKWVRFAHLTILLGFVLPVVGFVLGPLFVLHTAGHRYPGVEAESTEALNFGITASVLTLVAMAYHRLADIASFMPDVWILSAPIALFVIVFVVRAVFRFRKGVTYRYPLTLRCIRRPEPRKEDGSPSDAPFHGWSASPTQIVKTHVIKTRQGRRVRSSGR